MPVSGGEPALAAVILRHPFPIRRKHPVRTRMRGAVGAGGEKPPATGLCAPLLTQPTKPGEWIRSVLD
ncbi:hypothetical protein RZS08_19670 [Arthrospira platensis SPKY1]|nr:hypothetical protein [Arthrospira platensis SPKY1]